MHPKILRGLLCRALTWPSWGNSPVEGSWAMSPGEQAVLHLYLWKCPSGTTCLCCRGHHLSWLCAGTESPQKPVYLLPCSTGNSVVRNTRCGWEVCWEQGDEAEHSPCSCPIFGEKELLWLPCAGAMNICVCSQLIGMGFCPFLSLFHVSRAAGHQHPVALILPHL